MSKNNSPYKESKDIKDNIDSSKISLLTDTDNNKVFQLKEQYIEEVNITDTVNMKNTNKVEASLNKQNMHTNNLDNYSFPQEYTGEVSKNIKQYGNKKEMKGKKIDDNHLINSITVDDGLVFTKDQDTYKEVHIGHETHLVDNNESITPDTDKGYLDIESVYKKLEQLKKLQAEEFLEQSNNKEVKENMEEEGILVNTKMSSVLPQKNELINLSQEIQFLKDTLDLIDTGQVFVKKYQYKESKTSKVLRFGINKNDMNVQKILDSFQYLKDENKSVSIKTLMQKDNLLKATEKITLETCEINIAKRGLGYLETLENGKCVLIDVFDRKNADTHTCVFVKQDDNILLLDPSNPSFSIFLKQCNEDLYVYTDKNKTIYTPIKNIRTGPQSNESRDCIDIAVKLAFHINNNTRAIPIDGDFISKDKIGFNHAIESVTNCIKVSSLFPKEVEKNVLKIKQSSNVLESHKASVLIKIFKKVSDFFSNKEENNFNELNLQSESVDSNTQKSVQKSIQDLATKFYSSKVMPNNYSNFIKDCFYHLHDYLCQDQELKVLGDKLSAEFVYIDETYGNEL